jgi:anti-sigma B factor antagonist
MKQNPLQCSVQPYNSYVTIIDVEGDITFAEDKLMATYNLACSPEVRVIIWDFEKLNYINSSGIGLLITLLIRASRQNIKMYAYGLKEHFAEVFTLTLLNEIFSLFENRQEAINEAYKI